MKKGKLVIIDTQYFLVKSKGQTIFSFFYHSIFLIILSILFKIIHIKTKLFYNHNEEKPLKITRYMI